MIVTIALAFLALILLTSIGIGYFLSAPAYKGTKSDHFNGNVFINPGDVKENGFLDLIKWATNRDPGSWERIEGTPPVMVSPEIPDSTLRIYYVNHSTFLIQVAGYSILTDPVWSDRVSPFSWAGPQRMRPPGIAWEDLPAIDLVLISHNHYDHLDISTLLRLEAEHSPLMISPLGVSAFLKKKGISNTVELDWWEDKSFNEVITISCVQAQHFSGRGMFDRNKTLWAGYVLNTPAGNVYFAGDTGYGDFFAKIGKEYGPIRLALLPIGAYIPRWFMSPIHISPEEAVRIHLDLNAEKSIGMHYGTFPLADDGMEQPVQDLEKAKKEHHVQAFEVLREGSYLDIR